MAKFRIEQYEVYSQTYEVDANGEADAIAKLSRGEAIAQDDSFVFVETCEDLGLPVENHQTLAKQLGCDGDCIIPGIRSIEKVV